LAENPHVRSRAKSASIRSSGLGNSRYEALVRAITYQQLTAKAGDAIIGRLKELFEGRKATDSS
jgi:3-methyladenine DNA glycosylase/8-oxoguanine DNA glycosylase